MSIRKEQVLAIAVLLLAVWIGRGYLGEPEISSRFAPQRAEYEAKPVPAAQLVAAAGQAPVRRDFCTEPSETQPLPPRELAFPPLAPLTVAGLPLDPGPDYGHLWLLHLDGAQVEGVTLQQGTGADGGGGDASGAGAEADPNAPMSEERAARIYDRVWRVNLSSPEFGTIEPQSGVDLFRLEETADFEGLKLRMRTFNLRERKLKGVVTFGSEGNEIARIQLAGSLRNDVTRRMRKVPLLPSHLGELRELIDWLLLQARNEAWVYEDAQRLAAKYLEMTSGSLDGLLVMQKVLRARGDLAGELALLESIQGGDRERAFQLEGLGELRARLGLWQDAEADLRKAVEIQPTDARSHGTLAEFLRQRGRGAEANESARRAQATLGSVQDPDARARIVRTIIGCRLAVGDVAGARDVIGMLDREHGQSYLRGCIAYVAGDVPTALDAFRQAGAGRDAGWSLLGQAACLVRGGEWQAAQDLLLRVSDQEPLLRHRAASGLALLCSRIGDFESALGYVDRALEAAPNDPYALYLRGRTLRLMGQYAGAEDALTQALAQRDDFVHAIAEMSAVQVALAAAGQGTDQAKALVAARRYADRAVELAPAPSVELCAFEGLRAFGVADPRAAIAAFERARDLAPDEPGRAWAKGALAVVAYSRGLVDDAVTSLERIARDLGRDDPMAQWANATLVAIEDHAQKEMLGDGFDRNEVGNIWAVDNDGTLGAKVKDGRLVLEGGFPRSGKGAVTVERVGAVQKGRNFLAASVNLQLGRQHERQESFVGLGIEIQRGRAGTYDLQVRVGLRDGKAFLYLVDGRDPSGGDALEQRWLDVGGDGFDAGARHDLELRVLPRGDENSRQLALQVYWNGALVASHDLKQLTGNTQTELKTVLFATGNKGSAVDVAFDDYRLERRKER